MRTTDGPHAEASYPTDLRIDAGRDGNGPRFEGRLGGWDHDAIWDAVGV